MQRHVEHLRSGTMARLEINGAHVGYDEHGAGPPVVLIHGDAADRRMWSAVAADLTTSHRVIWYDRRGYGESTDPVIPVAHHRDVIAMLDALDVQRAALVGCSMGGAYAIDAALDAPNRVAALALVSPGLTGYTWPDSMLAQAATFVGGAVPAERRTAYVAGTPDTVREDDVRAMALAQARFLIAGPDRGPTDIDADVWRRCVEMLEQVFRREWSRTTVDEIRRDPAAVDHLGEIDAPTLVVNGLEDVPGIQALADVLVDGIVDAVRVDLPATAHSPPMERPTEVAAAVRDLLNSAAWR